MPVYLACPNLDSWERFLLGQLPAGEAETLEAHLAGCADCGERLGTLEAGDTLAEALRLRPGEAADESDLAEVEALVERVQQARSVSDHSEADGDHSTPPSSADEICDFLEPPQTPDELGRFGSYRVLRVLGSGGMGLVLEAEELKLKRRVAIKVMKPSRARHKLERQRFLREAQATAAIEHPHIVTIFHVGEVGETPFLAMQLLKGESLEARLRRMAKGGSPLPTNLARERDEQGAGARARGDTHTAGPRVGSPGLMPVSESLRIGHEIAEALAEAHERGLIHRDIKPSNVWLEAPRGFVKLVDFGLAHVADDVHLTRSGMVLGTPAYMSPEQARGDAVDGRGDLFSLGCVLYKLLTGGVPFQGSSTFAVLSALAIQEPQSPADLEPSVPAAVSGLVMRLLAKRPEDRFESARAVAEAIATLEQGVREGEARAQVDPCPTVVPAELPPERHLQTPNSRNRRRLLIATAAAAVVLLAGVVVTVKDKNGKTLLRRLFSDGATVTVDHEDDGAPPEALPPDKMERDGGVIEPTPSTDPDRRAAEWVLSVGGTLCLPHSTQYKSVASLPNGPLRLTMINLGDRGQTTDAGLAHLKDCKYLTLLSLHNTLVSDAGLPNLKDCKELTQLYLQNTQVSDAGLADLARLPRLASLAIRNTRISLRGHEQLRAAMPKCQINWSETNRAVAESVLALGGSVDIGTPGQPESRRVEAATDLPSEYFQVRSVSLAGVAQPLGKLPEDLSWLRFPEFDRLERLDLSGIPWLNYDFLAHIHGLRELSLAGSKLSDESLAKLPKLPALERLLLDGNEIRGPGLTHLREQPELTELSLACPTLGDLLAKHLADLKQVKRLSLAGSGLTDLGIKHLAALTGLETLDLRYTATTATGVAELRAALPMCRIEWGIAGLPASEPRP